VYHDLPDCNVTGITIPGLKHIPYEDTTKNICVLPRNLIIVIIRDVVMMNILIKILMVISMILLVHTQKKIYIKLWKNVIYKVKKTHISYIF
jgi:hypothetical protein